ncbi:hypothetical protein TorRG33x02_136280 [Trema orientale]|uniref:Uncharacterized protein n=1 Tax=Trema orientale TaxID=63057 RepID=A0A2P5EYG5_TREOI|nr:hypothetical protein TorRG33x02_136280 [Trema orientale]
MTRVVPTWSRWTGPDLVLVQTPTVQSPDGLCYPLWAWTRASSSSGELVAPSSGLASVVRFLGSVF